ncbi:MAG: peptidylprolyl isomerase [Thiothrix sp.]|uniref:peptidylprolyl isomerase n=1 Tax=Thiothrix sp. TaxID=1032 RepID=UPI0026023ED3|nr:peptidylprolyl isomerase [Thiothrix sp.]MDD5392362.1 peptidylprolyl isomerase [Thiothrix sp.]
MVTNKALRYFSIVAALIAVLASTQPAQAETDTPIDQIAAVVNNSSILLSEAQQRMATQHSTLKQAIDDLILERLQVQKAKEAGIPDGDPAQMIAALRKQQLQGKIKVSDQEVADLIASQSDTITQGERYNLQHILIATPVGVSVAQANTTRQQAEQIRSRILAGEDFAQLARSESDSNAAKNGGNLGWQDATSLPSSFTRAITLLKTGDVSEVIRDTKGFHILKLLEREGGKRQAAAATAIRTRHILVSTEKLPEEQAKQKIDALYQQLKQGASFAQLAQANSDDPGSAAKGGDLGWVTAGQTVAEFEQVMNQIADNAISKPFKTQFGWHILQVLAHKQEDRTVDSLRNKASDFIGERKAEEQYQAWLQGLRNSAYIDYRVPLDNNLQLH